MILCGTKIDAREEHRARGLPVVDEAQAVYCATSLGSACKAWLETSSQTQEGIPELIEAICRIGISHKSRIKVPCWRTILT